MPEAQEIPPEIVKLLAKWDQMVKELLEDATRAEALMSLMMTAMAATLGICSDKLREVYGQPGEYPRRAAMSFGYSKEAAEQMVNEISQKLWGKK